MPTTFVLYIYIYIFSDPFDGHFLGIHLLHDVTVSQTLIVIAGRAMQLRYVKLETSQIITFLIGNPELDLKKTHLTLHCYMYIANGTRICSGSY